MIRTLRGRSGGIAVLAAGSLAALALMNHALTRRAERRYPAHGKFITIDGVKLHYLDRGQGEPLVLLHGNGAMAEDFEISGLPQACEDHRVIAFDRPGFGHSERPPGRIWSAQRQARLILKALDALGIHRPVVLGHSWGSLVGLAMAVEQPQALAGLVLLSGYYFPTLRGDIPFLSLPAIPGLGTLWRHTVMPLLGRFFARHARRKLFAPAPVPERFRRGFPLALSLRPSQLRASAAESALMLLDAARLSRHYAELTLPLLIIAGDGDRLVDPARQSQRLHRAVSGSRYICLSGVGHMTHYASPGRLAAAVRSVLPMVTASRGDSQVIHVDSRAARGV